MIDNSAVRRRYHATTLTATQAAYWFNVRVNTIVRWRLSGKIESVGVNARGDRLYRLADLARAERETRRSARGRPRKKPKLNNPSE